MWFPKDLYSYVRYQRKIMKKLPKTRILELNEAFNKVLIWFFSYPLMEIGLSDLADVLKISKATANRVVKDLEKEGFLNIKVIGKVWRITCNQKHAYNYTRKIGYNLEMIYSSPILPAISEVIKSHQAIILFGSYRKGDDTEKSDIDIAIEVLSNEELKIIPLAILPEFGFRKDVPVNLHVFSRAKINHNLFANIANGIVLDGFLEVKP